MGRISMIYQTDNIEEAIRRMTERNSHSIVFQTRNYSLRQVGARLNLVSDIPSVLVRSWDAGHAKTVIEKWKLEGGLMYWRHWKQNIPPTTKAMLFMEMPLSIVHFETFRSLATNETIIFRPPDWSMHDEMIDYKFPPATTHRRMFDALKETPDDLTNAQKLVLNACGWDTKGSIVFSEKELCARAGLIPGQVCKYLASSAQTKRIYWRIDPIKPMIEPQQEDLLEIYRLLEALPNIGGGMRMLTSSQRKIPFLRKALRQLAKQKCVAVYEPVHILFKGWKEADYDIRDAVAGVYRERCMQMRRLVEDAPKYEF